MNWIYLHLFGIYCNIAVIQIILKAEVYIYSWDTANIGFKHESINQSINHEVYQYFILFDIHVGIIIVIV